MGRIRPESTRTVKEQVEPDPDPEPFRYRFPGSGIGTRTIYGTGPDLRLGLCRDGFFKKYGFLEKKLKL